MDIKVIIYGILFLFLIYAMFMHGGGGHGGHGGHDKKPGGKPAGKDAHKK